MSGRAPARHVIVVGAGIAGTGAALAAAAAEARVSIVDGGAGATTLCTGAFDVGGWGHGGDAEVLDGPVARALGLLDTALVPDGGVLLLSTAGVMRRARACDAALFDLRAVRMAAGRPRARIGVISVGRPGWDAQALARAFSEASGDDFLPVEAALVRHTDEAVLPDVDFAARHDDEERAAWLSDRLREALRSPEGPFDGFVVPPMLGAARSCAAVLSARVGVPCGEALGFPGGPPGSRYEHGRDRVLAAAGVRSHSARSTSVAIVDGVVRVTLDEGPPLDGDAAVVATGGLLGGGLSYSPSESTFGTELPVAATAPITATVAGPFRVGFGGKPLELPGSLFGFPPEALMGAFDPYAKIERLGILCDRLENSPTGRLSIFVAGDVAADEPRSWLAAFASGFRAGQRAARAIEG